MKGFSLIEIMLGVGLLALFTAAIVGSLVFSEQSEFISSQKSRAIDLAEEGLEAARNIRDEKYASVLTGGNGLGTSSVRWNFFGTEDITDETFTRVVAVAQVDNTRKKVTSKVTWDITPARQGQVELVTRLTDWRRTIRGGAPTLFGTLDLTTSNSGNNNANSISVAFKAPYVFLGRSQSAGGSEFYVIDATNPASPSLIGQLSLSGDPNDIAVQGNYAYIASSDNGSELQVIDISAPSSPTLAASFDLTVANSGNATVDGLSVAATGTVLVYARAASGGVELINFDISIPTTPAISGTLGLSGDPNDITVSGKYVFVASSDNTSELQVVDNSLSSSPLLAGSFNLGSGDANADAKALTIADNTLFMGRAVSVSAPEFYVLDISSPTSPTLISTFDFGTGQTVTSMDNSTSTPPLVFVANTSATASDYRAVDVSDLTTPTPLTVLNLNGTPNKLVYGVAPDKVFVASTYDTEELQIVEP